jgi:EAL domain-containing protein (putative c-di-GMP-specific phosphodiesterase class I)
MIMDVEKRVALEGELRSALASNRIVPHYQPVVALDHHRVVGFEALARWQSDNFGSVGPDQFIAVAEETGLISELADQLLHQACRDARRWPAQITLAVNVSAIQLRDATLGSRILAILARADFSPQRLELEITETALIEQIEVAQKVVKQLRSAGVRIALDDFGTGYATLSQLLSFRIDRIKIDRRFVSKLGMESNSAIIVRAILGLADEFGLSTTAEGIENIDQIRVLRANGCKNGQGHLFGPAIPAEGIVATIEKLTAFPAGTPMHSPALRQPCL